MLLYKSRRSLGYYFVFIVRSTSALADEDIYSVYCFEILFYDVKIADLACIGCRYTVTSHVRTSDSHGEQDECDSRVNGRALESFSAGGGYMYYIRTRNMRG